MPPDPRIRSEADRAVRAFGIQSLCGRSGTPGAYARQIPFGRDHSRHRIGAESRPRLCHSAQPWCRVHLSRGAYKHVPLVESNVVEGIHNNIFGTEVLAEAAVKAGVRAFILISTDKAVRPANIMGASKRLAELVCQTIAARQDDTLFSIVRFGNVLDSSGSVIPLFRRQIAAGGPITVTHPEITRYFMTISEASQLVIQAGAMAKGGDVFVLDMGAPVRIVDLAVRMAQLSGLSPVVVPPGAKPSPSRDQSDIEICFTGLRPGEKLYEELLIGNEAMRTEHPRIMTETDMSQPPENLAGVLERLKQFCKSMMSPRFGPCWPTPFRWTSAAGISQRMNIRWRNPSSPRESAPGFCRPSREPPDFRRNHRRRLNTVFSIRAMSKQRFRRF
ncbi:hypothetical protein A7A09_009845 [Paracoccus methylarcula]|uniref:Polysaccharide biosynthesis protein CapD-like domain-containing protein n=1 Tax=Paracoccus methylarcula TaxID=72022 RepID=A0A3R7P4P9_9RHOB|nr:hypothetical protein A7A09_009845 [Paracoccus methylarcula]